MTDRGNVTPHGRENISIVAFPQMIPDALRIAMEEIEERHGEIPRDRDVVLYRMVDPLASMCDEASESRPSHIRRRLDD